MSRRVSLFVTCVIDQLFPQAGLAMATVLERLGCTLDFPAAQTCCGQPAFNSGYRAEARGVALHFLRTFRDAEAIVVPSGSCKSMITHHYAELFASEPARLEEVRGIEKRTFEFSQFLTEELGVDDVGAELNAVTTYHDSCHALRELKIKDGPRRLLAKVKGLELREMDAAEECCGFGGTFSVKVPEVSGGMARTKIESIKRTGAEVVVSIDSSCLMQLHGAIRRDGLSIRAMHLAEVLAAR